jgi:hypothetical protein
MGDARRGNCVATTPRIFTRRRSPMVRPLFNDVRRMRSDVSRDDVRHAVADAWSLLTEISSALAESPPGEPVTLGVTPLEPGWGKLAELAGTLELSSRTLRVMLVRLGIDAARESSTFRVRQGGESREPKEILDGTHKA